jgi:hypothetical protein
VKFSFLFSKIFIYIFQNFVSKMYEILLILWNFATLFCDLPGKTTTFLTTHKKQVCGARAEKSLIIFATLFYIIKGWHHQFSMGAQYSIHKMLFDEKNQRSKLSWHCPFKMKTNGYEKEVILHEIMMPWKQVFVRTLEGRSHDIQRVFWRFHCIATLS